MIRQLCLGASFAFALFACGSSKSAKLAADSGAAVNSPNLRDVVHCKEQTEHDKLKKGECTGTDSHAAMLTAGQYTLRNHNEDGSNMGCWGIEGPDKMIWVQTYTGRNLVGFDQTNQPIYQDTYQSISQSAPDTDCRVQASSPTYNPNTTFMQMQDDGNVVFYASTDVAPANDPHDVIFYGASHTEGNPGAVLQLSNKGDLFITDVSGKRIWSH